MGHVNNYETGYARGHDDFTSGRGWAKKPYEGPSRQLSIHFIDGYRCGYLDAQREADKVK